MKNAISIKDLSKKYGELNAVDNISFDVEIGHFFAFLGPNGAGKSTTINIICTLLEKTSGNVNVYDYEVGKNDADIRNCIGIVFQDNVLDPLLSVKDNLMIRGGLYIHDKKALKDKLHFITEVLDIEDILKRPFRKLSGGQQRRVEIARALMSNPKILILDEPTTGLDPQARINVWNAVAKLKEQLDMTIFLTTHYMEEATNADMVAIIDRGKIVAAGTPSELKEKYSSDILHIAPKNVISFTNTLKTMNYPYKIVADVVQINVKNSLEAYTLLKEFEGSYLAFEVLRGTMDDVFLNITGRSIKE